VPTALKVVFWVDDEPRGNLEIIQEAEKKDIQVRLLFFKNKINKQETQDKLTDRKDFGGY
jgi:hypothetical protein